MSSSAQERISANTAHSGSSDGGDMENKAQGSGGSSNKQVFQEKAGNWSENETELLIRLWGQPSMQRELLANKHNIDIYNRIAAEMKEHLPETLRTGVQCRYRIKRLKIEYINKNKDPNTRRSSLFPFFFNQMEAALAERAKIAEQLSKEGDHNRKRKRNRTTKKEGLKTEDEHAESSSAFSSSATLVHVDGTPVKIEIDNAEEYEYGMSSLGHALVANTPVNTLQQISHRSGASAQNRRASDNGEDTDTSDGPKNSKQKRSGLSKQSASKPLQHSDAESDSDTLPLVIASDLGQLEDVEQADHPQESSTFGDASSAGGDAVSESLPDASSNPASPHFTIESVYQVKESGDEEGNEPEGDLDSSQQEPDTTDSTFTDPTRNRAKADDVANKADALQSTSSSTNDVDSRDTRKEMMEKLDSQADKDLQIIAEWSVSNNSEQVHLVTTPEDGQEPPKKKKKKKKRTVDKDSPGKVVSKVFAAEPQLGFPSFESATASSSGASPASSGTKADPPQQTLKLQNTSQYQWADVGGTKRAYLTTYWGDKKVVTPRISNVSTAPTMSLKGTSLLAKPGMSLLTNKPVVSFPSGLTAATRGSAPPKVIICGGPFQKGTVTSASAIRPMSSSSSHAPSASPLTTLIIPRTAAESKAVSLAMPGPIRLGQGSPSPSLSSVSVGIGGKVIRVNTPTSSSTSASSASSTNPVSSVAFSSSSSPKSAPSLTFTTLSSMDPVPKTVTLTNDPQFRVSSSSKPQYSLLPPSSRTITAVNAQRGTPPQDLPKAVKTESPDSRSKTSEKGPFIFSKRKRALKSASEQSLEGVCVGPEAEREEGEMIMYLSGLDKPSRTGQSERTPVVISPRDLAKLKSGGEFYIRPTPGGRSKAVFVHQLERQQSQEGATPKPDGEADSLLNASATHQASSTTHRNLSPGLLFDALSAPKRMRIAEDPGNHQEAMDVVRISPPPEGNLVTETSSPSSSVQQQSRTPPTYVISLAASESNIHHRTDSGNLQTDSSPPVVISRHLTPVSQQRYKVVTNPSSATAVQTVPSWPSSRNPVTTFSSKPAIALAFSQPPPSHSPGRGNVQVAAPASSSTHNESSRRMPIVYLPPNVTSGSRLLSSMCAAQNKARSMSMLSSSTSSTTTPVSLLSSGSSTTPVALLLSSTSSTTNPVPAAVVLNSLLEASSTSSTLRAHETPRPFWASESERGSDEEMISQINWLKHELIARRNRTNPAQPQSVSINPAPPPLSTNHTPPPALSTHSVSSSLPTNPASRLLPHNCTPLSKDEEDDLFSEMLGRTDLPSECQKWMLETLQIRSRSASSASQPSAATSSSSATTPSVTSASSSCSAAATTTTATSSAAAGTGVDKVEAQSEESSSKENAVEKPSRDGADVEVTNLVLTDGSSKQTGTFKVKAGLAQMAKGGIIMDVTTAEEARVAEEAGACAVMALERVPADIRRQGGVARMTDPKKIKDIMASVTIPVMAKCRIGHFAEAQILESLGVDMVDESEVLTPADEEHHVDKHAFKVPFVCGARDLGEALRRISEGAAMIRTKGEAGTGDVVEAVRHARTIKRQIGIAQSLDHTELYNYAKELCVPYDLLKKTAELGRLPVVNFAAGGLATPADVSLLMQLGVDGVFVGSGIFKSSDPPSRARAMAQAVTHYKDPKILASISEGLGEAMFGSPVTQQMRDATSGPGNKQQEKLWNATLAMDKFKIAS